MDLGFARLEPAIAESAPAPLDYFRLIATLSAMQASSRTAVVEAQLAAGGFSDRRPLAALVELFTAGSGWAAAADALGGSFHPGAAIVVNGESPP